jgi:hypothetical protein
MVVVRWLMVRRMKDFNGMDDIFVEVTKKPENRPEQGVDRL